MKAVILFSSGLDSILAAKLMKNLGVELEAIHFVSEFFPLTKRKKEKLSFFAEKLGILLAVRDITREFIEVLKSPKYGYGKNLNPCIDCKILMFKKAKEFMEEKKAAFIVSGEVLGQRLFSQRKEVFEIIEKEADLKDLILRPLSARLLNVSIPEKKGWVSRERLFAFRGKSRIPQINLAKKLGIYFYPQPGGGCFLTDPSFARRVKDLLKYNSDFTLEDVKLLRVGRHFRISGSAKLVVFRNDKEKKILKDFSYDNFIKFFSQKGEIFSLGIGKFEKEDIDISAKIVGFYLKSNRVKISNKRQKYIFVTPLTEEKLKEYRI